MNRKLIIIAIASFAIASILMLTGYGKKSSSSVELMGAGATFPYPLYSKMFDEYYKENGAKVNYQAIGSGGGIRQLLNKVVDFGGTDAFLSDEELAKAPAKILHIPTCLGAVVVTYNISGNPTLKLTPDVIADIFLGKINKWNDKRIKSLNPNVKLPNANITVVHRSDGSGTTFIFSDYLSKVNSEWSKKVGRGTSLNWPVGLGGKGNPGVAGLVTQSPNSIGYVELIYALQNNMPYASIKNKKGNFVMPTLKSVSLAANIDLSDDTRVSITDTDSKDGYPISSFTWIIFYQEQNYNSRNLTQAKALMELLDWMIHNGQSYNEELQYSPLPKAAVKKAEKILKSVTYNGKKIF